MNEDAELLRRFTDERSEMAFAELVGRHLDFVYDRALRRVGGDAHLAQDIVQQVFTALARQAGALRSHPTLAGWLYTTTRNLSAQLVRTERRRKAREEAASLMNETHAPDEPPADWSRLRPALDEVFDQLGETDRAVLLLRFFEGRSFAETGARLRLSENAARMRAERALDKMRQLFARQGLHSTAITLGTLLAEPIVSAAPAGLATSVTSTALTTAAAGTGLGVITFMSMTKLPWIIVAGLVVAGAGGLVVHEHTRSELKNRQAAFDRQEAELARLQIENTALRHAADRSPVGVSPTPSSVATPASSSVSGTKPSRITPDKVALAPGLIPIDSLEHTGRATPRAAFATQLWAAAHGDVDLEAHSIVLTPEARAKLAALIATLPEPSRTQYPFPDGLMASVLAGSPHPVGGMRILNEISDGPDHAILQTEWQHVDDQIVHHSEIELQRDDSGWRFVVPTVLVDRAVAYLSKQVPAPPPVTGHP